MADVVARDIRVAAPGRQTSLQKFARRKSTIAFLFALPLIVIIACLVVYPRTLFGPLGNTEQVDDKVRRLREFRVSCSGETLSGWWSSNR